VAKGLLTQGELESIHQRMCQELADAGAVIMEFIDAHTKRNLLAVAANQASGMLLTTGQTHELELISTWVIGGADLFALSLPDAVRQLLALEP
jgi:histidinol phosphatase-like enzyme